MNRHTAIPLIFLVVWGCASVIAGSALTSFHQPFLVPAHGMAPLGDGPVRGWRAIHVLAADCGCSARVFEHLAGRAPLDGVTEEVMLIGNAEAFPRRDRLLKRGFSVRAVGEQELEKWRVKGAPLLVFVAPANEIAYMGGYGAGDYRDEAIWHLLRAGERPAALPVLGCAVGQRLRKKLDPFSMKYGLSSVIASFR